MARRDEPSAGPLAGRSIVVTRATAQSSALVERLAALGADVIEVPVIAIVDASDRGAALAHGVSRVDEFDWVVVTSTNGVDRVVAAAACAVDGDGATRSPLATSSARFAAIGRGTAGALERHGLQTALLPERFVAEGLLEVFPPPPAGGGRVLLAQAAGARPVLADGLRSAGWQVEVVEAYRTIHPPVPTDRLAVAAGADAITFTSASTVEGWMGAAGTDALPPVVVTIGPVTTAAAIAHGVDVDVEASVHTIDGLVDALIGHLTSGAGST